MDNKQIWIMIGIALVVALIVSVATINITGNAVWWKNRANANANFAGVSSLNCQLEDGDAYTHPSDACSARGLGKCVMMDISGIYELDGVTQMLSINMGCDTEDPVRFFQGAIDNGVMTHYETRALCCKIQ